MKVLIVPTEYVDVDGVKRSSSVYHYIESRSSCLSSAKEIHEVPEETAKLFGRHLCKTCEDRRDRQILLAQVQAALPKDLMEEWQTKLGSSFELRVYWYPPGVTSTHQPKSPKIIWSSRSKER